MRFSRLIPRLPVQDLTQTIRFYGELLGFKCGAPWPAEDPTFTILSRDHVEVQFYVPEPDQAEPTGHGTLSWDVDDANALHRELVERGVEIEWGPEVYWYGRREFGVCDPDGYLLVFSEETDDPPTCQEA